VEEREEELQELRDDRTGLEVELEKYQELQEKVELWEKKEKWADEVYQEIESTISVYEEVKSELREKYIAYINEFTNDIFEKIYKNSSYQQVIVDEVEDNGDYDYTVELLTDENTTEDPSNASGGERAIVNLSLRAGIYRLIAKREGGEQSRLPPFILDEPTTFLDEDHVERLEDMLEEIEEWDVPQVIVVSHDEQLIHGADHECVVRKDEATDSSQIEVRKAGED
jgi:DNA repair exonuclease SbcCD ATPase subunit